MPKAKYPYIGGTDWAFMKFMDITDRNDPTDLYLRRLIIFKTPLCAIYLHFIYRPDNDRHPHNHPMSFLSLVLAGGYREGRWVLRRRMDNTPRPTYVGWRERRRLTVASTKRGEYHFIKTLFRVPTVTLIFCGRRTDEWGFLVNGKMVPWREYING